MQANDKLLAYAGVITILSNDKSLFKPSITSVGVCITLMLTASGSITAFGQLAYQQMQVNNNGSDSFSEISRSLVESNQTALNLIPPLQ